MFVPFFYYQVFVVTACMYNCKMFYVTDFCTPSGSLPAALDEEYRSLQKGGFLVVFRIKRSTGSNC